MEWTGMEWNGEIKKRNDGCYCTSECHRWYKGLECECECVCVCDFFHQSEEQRTHQNTHTHTVRDFPV